MVLYRMTSLERSNVSVVTSMRRLQSSVDALATKEGVRNKTASIYVHTGAPRTSTYGCLSFQQVGRMFTRRICKRFRHASPRLA